MVCGTDSYEKGHDRRIRTSVGKASRYGRNWRGESLYRLASIFWPKNDGTLPIIVTSFQNIKSVLLRAKQAQRGGGGASLLLHDLGAKKRWVVNATHREPNHHATPSPTKRDAVPSVLEAESSWAGVNESGKSCPYRCSSPGPPSL